jgi:hypothetical protein
MGEKIVSTAQCTDCVQCTPGQCCGSGMFIPDPRSRIRLFPSRIPNPGSESKNLSILTPPPPKKKNDLKALENIIRVVHPGSRIRMLTFYPSRIPDPGDKKAPDPGSGSATLHMMKISYLLFLCICY